MRRSYWSWALWSAVPFMLYVYYVGRVPNRCILHSITGRVNDKLSYLKIIRDCVFPLKSKRCDAVFSYKILNALFKNWTSVPKQPKKSSLKKSLALRAAWHHFVADTLLDKYLQSRTQKQLKAKARVCLQSGVLQSWWWQHQGQNTLIRTSLIYIPWIFHDLCVFFSLNRITF